MKISAYHKKNDDLVVLMKDKTISQKLIYFDKIYISCIFDENKDLAFSLQKQFKNSILGGVGVNNIKLPDYIDHSMPDYYLYPNIDYSLGFTTRGCIRSCDFCKVKSHEGGIQVNCDIYEFYNSKFKKILILDNNILALPEHFKKIAGQIQDNNLQVDFNQGLDHRLLTPEIAKLLLSLKHIHEIRFAFDKVEYEKSVNKAFKILREAGLKDYQTRWYVYVGINDTFETVKYRIKILQEHKQKVYLMRDRRIYNKPEFTMLAQYCNCVKYYKAVDLDVLYSKIGKEKFDKKLTKEDEKKLYKTLDKW